MNNSTRNLIEGGQLDSEHFLEFGACTNSAGSQINKYSKFPNNCYRDIVKLNLKDIAVLNLLLLYSSKSGNIYNIRQSTICKDLNMKKSTLELVFKNLKLHKIIDIKYSYKNEASYKILRVINKDYERYSSKFIFNNALSVDQKGFLTLMINNVFIKSFDFEHENKWTSSYSIFKISKIVNLSQNTVRKHFSEISYISKEDGKYTLDWYSLMFDEIDTISNLLVSRDEEIVEKDKIISELRDEIQELKSV